MSSTCWAKSGDWAPGCCSNAAYRANLGEATRRAKENRGGISSPSTTRADCGGDGGPAASSLAASCRRCPERPSPRSIRPGYRPASVPNASTTASAVWWPSCTAPEPTRIRLVAAATAPISTAGEELATPGTR
jgi:hypothetical protein